MPRKSTKILPPAQAAYLFILEDKKAASVNPALTANIKDVSTLEDGKQILNEIYRLHDPKKYTDEGFTLNKYHYQKLLDYLYSQNIEVNHFVFETTKHYEKYRYSYFHIPYNEANIKRGVHDLTGTKIWRDHNQSENLIQWSDFTRLHLWLLTNII